MFNIINVSKAEEVFGGNMKELMPDMNEIPDEFHKDKNKWCKITSTWFFSGLSKDTEFYPKMGVDPAKAIRHIKAILSSFNPKHEHKTAGVSFLLSEWFDDIKNYKTNSTTD